MENAGYTIIANEIFKADEGLGIALGSRESKYSPEGTQYVTWQYRQTSENGKVTIEYYWGHYFLKRANAYTDYHSRLLAEYERQQTADDVITLKI